MIANKYFISSDMAKKKRRSKQHGMVCISHDSAAHTHSLGLLTYCFVALPVTAEGQYINVGFFIKKKKEIISRFCQFFPNDNQPKSILFELMSVRRCTCFSWFHCA